MYKVFINNRPLVIVERDTSLNEVHFEKGELKEAIKKLRKGKLDKATVAVKDPKKKWKKFKKEHKVIKAGGGVVRNKKGEILFIFRKGKWDLPKGKKNKGEKVRDAAKREVEEETSVKKLVVGEKIVTTWHTYRYKTKHALKKTNWYRMTTTSTSELVPEDNEGIKAAEWLNDNDLKKVFINTYEAVKEVLALE